LWTTMLLTTFNLMAVAQTSITPRDPGNFVTTWDTTIPGESGNNQITIPTTGDGYHYAIYWEQIGGSERGKVTGLEGGYTIFVDAPGIYRVEISGDFPRIYFN